MCVKCSQLLTFRERVILSLATDLGLRAGDFTSIKKNDLPDLEREPPIPFDIMTEKRRSNSSRFFKQRNSKSS